MTAVTEQVISVGELGRRLKRAAETCSGDEWVEGEVGSLRRASSGHVYFCLRDEREDAAIDCVMYRLEAQRARAHLDEGARVQLRGRPTFWAPRGRLQFVASRSRPAGRGALLEALELLKRRLEMEGLFEPSRKRQLPPEVEVVGVVTSAAGAAFQDVCTVAFRRGGARIILSPALVQGEGAAESIVRAIDLIESCPGPEVLIIGRGGGSGEDLMVFNEERVVRRIARCALPVVSAVGHDIDVTLADLVADVRAATPSQAAELVIPDRRARRRVLEALHRQLLAVVRDRVHDREVRLERYRRRLNDPRFLIVERQMALDDLRWRAERQARRTLSRHRSRVEQLGRALERRHPERAFVRCRSRLEPLGARLASWADRRIEFSRGRLADHAARLEMLSPLAVLARGYALVSTTQGHLVRRAGDLAVGERVRVRVGEGEFRAMVTDVDARGSRAEAATPQGSIGVPVPPKTG